MTRNIRSLPNELQKLRDTTTLHSNHMQQAENINFHFGSALKHTYLLLAIMDDDPPDNEQINKLMAQIAKELVLAKSYIRKVLEA
ncbi:hypothetical protein N7493_009861 [Penicillium malachiteum]|uniref:Uncharacterized protein n=1 Tax=Penicillium malachiteum TaxID=1324776 RepID=A0AAD6HE15_9EURO|nr:hypothetical protein N7493_009861 [Penicillium malachiteum]